MTYREQLRDVRWQKLRLVVLESVGWKCQDCGSNDFLNVHHRRYVAGRAPLEYSIDDLKVLCERCHQKIHGLVFVPSQAEEGEHQCGDWKAGNWHREGTTFCVDGIPFELTHWDFCEDGMYGGIYFAVSDLLFEECSSDGASYRRFTSAEVENPNFPACDGHGVEVRGLVRCATPCMQNGENFMPFPMEWIIFQAAQFALDNLTRKKT